LSFRHQYLALIEFLILLASAIVLILLGSLFVLRLKQTLPYLPLVYSLISVLFFVAVFWLGTRRIFPRPSIEQVARGLETKFPRLKDDVTNSVLLFRQIKEGLSIGQVSKGLVFAQLRRTVEKVDTIKPDDVVSIKKGFRHLRLLVPLSAILGLVLIVDPHFLGRSLAVIMHPLSDLPSLQTVISVEPKASIVLRGAPVDVRATVTGNLPQKLMLTVWPEGSGPVRFPMESEGKGRFRYRMAAAQVSFQYQAVNGRAISPVGSIRVVDAPDLGILKLTLIPPSYTRLPSEVREDGHVEALKGTLVNLDARATKSIKEGQMVLNEESRHPLEVNGERLTGSLLVLQPGSYAISMKDELGFANPNPVRYQIRVIPDKYPEAEIASPDKDLEITGDEVIPIMYRARDDFGITAMRLAFQVRGEERFISLKSANQGRIVGPETFKWDLSTLALTPGESVSYRIEVDDNDAVSGPKKGYSRNFTLFVRDARAIALKEGEEAQGLVDALLELLADQLEETRDNKALARQMEAILKRVEKNLEQIGNRVERIDMEALRRNLASLKERIAQEPKEKATQEMERLVLLAEDIAKRSRMNEVEAMAREIRNRQRHLVDALKEFKGPLSREQTEAVTKELKKLEELLKSVMEALGKLATRLPDEFINSQELSGLEFQDLFSDLDEMYKKLMEGDTAGALEAAQRLLQQLSEMMASLGRAGTRAGTSPLDRMQSEMSRQAGELDKILAEQKQILSETERIDGALKAAVDEETRKRLDTMLPRLLGLLDQVHGLLPPEQADLVEESERLLKEGKIERFSALAKELEKDLSGRPEAQRLAKELSELTGRLAPGPDEVVQNMDKGKFPDLSTRQGTLKERTSSFLEKLEMFAQLFPGMDTEVLKDIGAAADSMGEAAGKLTRENAPGAIPPEEEAIRRMSKSQEGMQQMAQQMGMRMQAARWGYQLAYDPRPGWYYGPWLPMPTLPQPELNFPREKGYTGIDKEEFDPPSKDAYRVPALFREKVMESLKEEVPTQYKKDVQRYLRGLAE
jgi:hypothetical protein